MEQPKYEAPVVDVYSADELLEVFGSIVYLASGGGGGGPV